MDFHGNINLKNNELQQMVLEQENSFPVNAKIGSVVFNGNVLYMAVAVNVVDLIWIPLTNTVDTYIHEQLNTSTSWVITHNLNSDILLVQVYDENNQMIIPDTVISTNVNSLTVTFAEPALGRVILMTGDVIPANSGDVLLPAIINTFLIVAAEFDGTSTNTNSIMYKWNTTTLQYAQYQSLATSGAADWELIVIDDVTYVVVANNFNGSTHNIDSIVYKWDDNSATYLLHQSIPTVGAVDWHTFTIGADQYLVVANNFNDTTRNIDSVVYKWNVSTLLFDSYQTISTIGAVSWESFTIGADQYLIVANNFDDTTRNVDSVLYKWNVSTLMFDSYQTISTIGAVDFEYFMIGSDNYLVVANYYNGSTPRLNSVVYKWNTGTFLFESYQSIATKGATDWEFFTIGSDSYLIVANLVDGVNQTVASELYKWNTGTLIFEPYQSISVESATDWRFYTLESVNYLAVANKYDGNTNDTDTNIFVWNNSTLMFDPHQTLTIPGA